MDKIFDFKLFAHCGCGISETPIWNKADKKLYGRGLKGEIYRKTFEYAFDYYECFQLNIGYIGGMALTKSNQFLVFTEHGRIWHWSPEKKPVLTAEIPGAVKGTLFNNVIVDPKGRIYCGILAQDFFDKDRVSQKGSLWRFNVDGSFTCLESVTGSTPNGSFCGDVWDFERQALEALLKWLCIGTKSFL